MLLGEAGKMGVCGYKPDWLALLAFGSTDTTSAARGGVVWRDGTKGGGDDVQASAA